MPTYDAATILYARAHSVDASEVEPDDCGLAEVRAFIEKYLVARVDIDITDGRVQTAVRTWRRNVKYSDMERMRRVLEQFETQGEFLRRTGGL
jgi:hypothetical protein